jgi:hypothetical protein
MSQSIVSQLVFKDLHIMRTYMLLYWVGGLGSIALVVLVGGEAVGVVGFILFVSAMAGAGIHALYQTIVEEKLKLNLPFIMSLPVTVKEYTIAKLIANLLMFGSVWLTLSAASFIIFVGDDGMPEGTMPFLSITLVAIFLAYTVMLMTFVVTGSQGYAIFAMVFANIGTQACLWLVADLYPIRAFIGGNEAVWNTTAVSILLAEVAIVIALLVFTVFAQFRKRDFI